MNTEYPGKFFIVCIHDVSPRHYEAVETQLGEVSSILDNRISLAVIPAEKGFPWSLADREFIKTVCQYELLMHGYSHSREYSCSPVSALCGWVDEFVSMESNVLLEKLNAGQNIFQEFFGRNAEGLLPPAWRIGSLNAEIALMAGFDYMVSFTKVMKIERSASVLLSTISWDWGKFAFLGRLGSFLSMLSSVQTGRVPVISIHPADNKRGFLVQAVKKIRGILQLGYKPVSFSDILGNA